MNITGRIGHALPCAIGIILYGSAVTSVSAQSADELAKATANPVANLISLPLQSNWEKGYGPGNDTQYTLNVQPVIPVKLNDEWNLITRTIVPFVHQPEMSIGQGDDWGLGDTVASFFLSPTAGGRVIWGAGPVLLLPTASAARLGTEKWGAGPSGVVLVQEANWTYGILANHLWSFAGDDTRREVNASFLNPFVTYSLGQGVSLTGQAELTYDWNAEQGKHTTMPLTISIGKVTHIGKQPISFNVGYRYFAETPNGNPEHGIRMLVNFLFPK